MGASKARGANEAAAAAVSSVTHLSCFFTAAAAVAILLDYRLV